MKPNQEKKAKRMNVIVLQKASRMEISNAIDIANAFQDSFFAPIFSQHLCQ